MNVVISDTAEYGNYLFANAAVPLLIEKFMPNIGTECIGKGLQIRSNSVNNMTLVEVNEAIQNHPVEVVGKTLRSYMTNMKSIVMSGS
jgi:ketol-acid reductoisomerase